MRPFVSRLRPVCLLLASVAPFAVHAETDIGSTTTGNLRTSTAASGAADNIVVTSTGAVTPTSGAAITVDSNNTVSNAGTVAVNSADNSTGIAVQGGTTTTITNSGTIRVDDSYAAADTNGDGIADGAFAQGTGRTGISVAGTGSMTGSIVNSGSIIVEGNNSFGVNATAPIVGGFQSTGSISVLGDNGTALKLGAVSGTVAVAGTVSATGQNSVGIALTGDVGGPVILHNTVSSTGYSATVAPTDTSTLLPSNFLQGGSAMVIGGNIAGGVVIGAALTAQTDTTIDSDGDGIGDSTEAAGALVTYGSAPSLLVGSTTKAITLSPYSTSGFGLVINGSVSGSGVYSGVNATGIQIGGTGQTTTIAGGIDITGSVNSNAIGGLATTINAASGAVIPNLTNAGSVYAYGGTTAGSNSQAIRIDAGATLTSIVNSGTIKAVTAVAGGLSTDMLDRSGTLTSVMNTGTISSSDIDNTGVAIDVSANTSGFTYTQSVGTVTPSLAGAILTGSGADTLAISGGTVTSAATLGAGNDTVALSGTGSFTGSVAFGAGNDSLTLADTSTFTGSVDFGTGANILTIGSGASFAGTILNSASNIAVSVANGGTLKLTGTGTVALSSLSLAGTLALTADPANKLASQITVAGATTIAAGAAVRVSLSSLSLTPFTFTVIKSGTLAGSANLSLSTSSLPYLLSGSFTSSDAAGTIALTIGPRAVGDYGFRPNEAAAYNAVYAAIAGNTATSTLFLGLGDRDSTVLRYRQMLPDYEGGTFDMLSKGERILQPGLNAVPMGTSGNLNLWAQQSWWNGDQHADLTAGYRGTGWGLVGGGDVDLGGFGRVGLSAGYIYTDVHNAVDNTVTANDFQGGAHWLAHWGGLQLSASGTAGFVRFGSIRGLTGASGNNLLQTNGHWSGILLSGNAAVGYEVKLGLFYLRPNGTFNYARLHENQHGESGGGSGYDLTIASRTSSELTATGMMAVGLHWGGKGDPELTSFRIEAEGGRRAVLSSSMGVTTAQFAGGQAFSLSPEELKGVYTGDIRFSFGSSDYEFSATAGGEERSGYHGLVGRLSLRAAL